MTNFKKNIFIFNSILTFNFCYDMRVSMLYISQSLSPAPPARSPPQRGKKKKGTRPPHEADGGWGEEERKKNLERTTKTKNLLQKKSKRFIIL